MLQIISIIQTDYSLLYHRHIIILFSTLLGKSFITAVVVCILVADWLVTAVVWYI